jgi:PAS domain S-box-containing protein
MIAPRRRATSTTTDTAPSVRSRLTGSARLRLTPYFLLLVLPLALGVWSFGNYTAGNKRERADAQLEARLAAAEVAYQQEVASAGRTARAVASSPRIQRALQSGDPTELVHYARLHPSVAFAVAGKRLAGARFAGVATRAVRVTHGGRTLGMVVVGVRPDESLLARIDGSRRDRRPELVAFDGRRILTGDHRGRGVRGRLDRTGDLRLGAKVYRAATTRLVKGSSIRLAAVEPRSVVTAAEDQARHRILLAGLAVLGGVALVAYALAPMFARTRFAQAQRAQAAQVLSHVGDGVFLVDRAGTIGFWNPGAETLTGLTAAAALRRRPEEVFRGWREHAPKPTPSDERPVAETGRYDVNGRELWLSVSGVESPLGTVYAFRDRTDEYRLEEERADFVATVSHELRTPLASIHGAARTLRSREDELGSATRRDLLEIVVAQSERLAHLVDQVLLANQLSSSSVHVERRGFDAATVAREAVGGLGPALPREIELELHLPRELPPVSGDPERVRQVLVNLIDNAAKYSPGGGRIDVLLTSEDGVVQFSVRDEGLGIPATEQGRIFEKFYRLDAGMRRGVGGSGLGLFIARELVELMGGRLWVRSQPGIGSSFVFELPVAETPAAAGAAAMQTG